MKVLLLAIALSLTLASAGWAEVTAEQIWAEQQAKPEVKLEFRQCLPRGPLADVNGEMFFDCFMPNMKGALLVGLKLHNAPCLAQMEAAMRAMEPWLVQDVDERLRFYADGKEFLMKMLTGEELKLYRSAMKQWTAAKACWKETP